MNCETFYVKTELEALPAFNDKVCNRLAAIPGRADDATVATILLLLDELVTNVIKYGHPGEAAEDAAEHAVEVRISWDDAEFAIEIVDDGVAFDATARPASPAAAADQPWEDRPVGGWGLELVRQSVDEFTYRRNGSLNKLTLRKRLAPAGEDL